MTSAADVILCRGKADVDGDGDAEADIEALVPGDRTNEAPSRNNRSSCQKDEAGPSPLTAAGDDRREPDATMRPPERAKLAEQEALHAKLVVSLSWVE